MGISARITVRHSRHKSPSTGALPHRFAGRVGLALLVAALFPLTAPAMPEAASSAAAAQTPAAGGSGSVSAQGQVTQSYAFALPPARLMPSVSLSYSSAGGDSDVGYGWSLAAGGRISRDFRRDDVALDMQDDSYVIDGVSLLRAAGDHTGSMVFERWGDATRSQIEFDATNNVWIEHRSDGVIRRYQALLQQQGTSSNALMTEDGPAPLHRRAGFKAQADRSAADRTLVWALSEEENVEGDLVSYYYEKPPVNPAYPNVQQSSVLVEIRYGGNVRLGTQPMFVVSIGRYMHETPRLLQGSGLAPANGFAGQCAGRNSLIGEGLRSHRYGGELFGPEGQRVWGVGVSVGNGGSTDASVAALPGTLSAYWRLGYNYDRVGCLNADELHANLESAEPFGRDPQTGVMIAGVKTTYEYNGWERHWTSVPTVLPADVAKPVFGHSALTRQMPTEPSVMEREIYSGSFGGSGGRYTGHWPSTNVDCSGEECLYNDIAGAPSTVQMLSDQNGDGIPDYVDFFSAQSCDRFASGAMPTFAPGHTDGSFGALQALSWAPAAMNATLGDGPMAAFCGAELWRSTLGSAYPTALPSQRAPFLAITGNESFQIDTDSDGYADTIRLIGNHQLFQWMLLNPPAVIDDLQWRTYRTNPIDLSMQAPRPWANTPWSVTVGGLAATLLKAPQQNVSATVRNSDQREWDDLNNLDNNGVGFDYSSSELGSLVDVTGDGIPDRIAAMKVGTLLNQPFPLLNTTYGEHAIPEQYALTVYRGQLLPGADGQMELQFNAMPEFWWTRAMAGDGWNNGLGGSFDPEQLAPATSATIRNHCYGNNADRCDETGLSVSQTIDMDGDGLADIVTTPVKLHAGFRRSELQGGGSYQLEPLGVLFSTGRGFKGSQLVPSTLGGDLPGYLSNVRMRGNASDITGESGFHFEHTEEVLEQFVDFNGDGFADMVQPHGVRLGGSGQLSAPLQVSLPSAALLPSGWMESARVVRWMAPAAGRRTREWQETREQTTQMIDMNGDGRPDLLVLNPTTRQTTLITDADLTLAPGRMRAVHDGLGGTIQYHYQTIAQALMRDPRGVPSKGFVLESIQQTLGTSSASGPQQTTKVAFSQGQYGRHGEGREDGQLAIAAAGFLGFGVVTTTLPTNQTIVERYDTSFGHEGLLLSRELRSASGQTLERTTHTYQDVAAHTRAWNGQTIQPADVHLPQGVITSTWHERSPGVYDPTPVTTAMHYVYPSGDALAYLGAPVEVVDEGDINDDRDSMRTVMSYQRGRFSDARGIFYTQVPTESRSYGTAADGTVTKLLSHTRSDYDCNPDNFECPSATINKGRLRQSVVFFDETAPNDEGHALRTRYYYDDRDGVLAHVADPAGRVTSYCYDPHHLQLNLVRQPDGRRTESVINLSNGAVIETRGPVGLSPRPLVGGPVSSAKADVCPAIDTQAPGFGGVSPSIPALSKYQTRDTLPVPKADRPIPPPTSVTAPSNAEKPQPPDPAVPYSNSNDPITAALRDRRPVPPGYNAAQSTLRLPWKLVGVDHLPTALSNAWVAPASMVESRQPYTPTVHTDYDGLGRVIRSLATTSRGTDGSYRFTQLNQNAEWFGESACPINGNWVGGIFHISQTLVAGDSYDAPNAKKHVSGSCVDGAGQTLWTQSLATAIDAPQQFANYGIEGAATQTITPDPQNPAAYVSSTLSQFDDRNQPRTLALSAGRTLHHESSFSWNSDGPHQIARTYRGLSGTATTRVSESEAIPRQRTVIHRAFVREGSDDAMVTKAVTDEMGRTLAVTNAEGQVTGYEYDLAGRPTIVSRYNSEADRVAHRPIETTRTVYPDVNDLTSPTEEMHSIGTHYAADGTFTTTDEVVQLDRVTGKVLRTIKPLSDDASLIGYGGVNLTYINNSAIDGYGQVYSESNPSETKTYTYNAKQQVESVTIDTVVRWPGTATTLVDRLIYTTEYEPSGAVRRTTIDTDGSFAGRLVTRYEYDEAGHIAKIWDETNPSATPVESYDYTALGQLYQRHDSRGGTKTVSYDHYGMLKDMTLTAPDLPNPYTQTIGRDENTGLPISITTNRPDGMSLMAGYQYNLAGQLTTATESGYVGHVTYRCNAETGTCDERTDTLNEVIPGGNQRHLQYRYAEGYDATQLSDQLNIKDGTPIHHYDYDPTGSLTSDGTPSR